MTEEQLERKRAYNRKYQKTYKYDKDKRAQYLHEYYLQHKDQKRQAVKRYYEKHPRKNILWHVFNSDQIKVFRTIHEVARFLGYSEECIRIKIKSGAELEGYKIKKVVNK